MLKTLKLVSISAIAIIMIAGCDSGSEPIVNDEGDSQVLPKVSQELTSFFKTRSSGADEQTNETIGKAFGNIRADQNQEIVYDCLNGGTISSLSDFNQTALMQNPQTYSFNVLSTFSDCIEDGITTNGQMQFNINTADNTKMRVDFLTDMVIQDAEEATTIKKDSFFVSEEVSETVSIETTSMEALSTAHSYKSENFKTYETDYDDGSTSSYEISGKQTIDGLTLIVDESYDASQTPMVTDKDENLQKGGKARYTNDQNHTIMIEAIETNKIQISIDEDGDGSVDKQEEISL